jgi:hypothetical protein
MISFVDRVCANQGATSEKPELASDILPAMWGKPEVLDEEEARWPFESGGDVTGERQDRRMNENK